MTLAPSPASTVQNSIDSLLAPADTFVRRHLGSSPAEIEQMLAEIGCESLDALIEQTVPRAIRFKKPLKIRNGRGEHEMLKELKGVAAKNKVFRSLIGQGYYGTITPPVVQRNILENPGWYTQYTPYQAEISQGRLEALLNFQTMVADLTGLPLANASMLDEGTAAAEAMAMARSLVEKAELDTFLIDADCHPQTIQVVQTRAWSLGIKTLVAKVAELDKTESKLQNRNFKIDLPIATTASIKSDNLFGVLVQYPATDGSVSDFSTLAAKLKSNGAMLICATDLLALTLLRPPGEFGADVAVGSAQRFGVPMGFGGPHAGFIATRSEYARKLPGRLVGVSKDAQGNSAYRLTLQTREQHIRRERATSNICTAQVLLAVIASMYACYHGPKGLRTIALRTHALTRLLANALTSLGAQVLSDNYFDTIRIRSRVSPKDIKSRSEKSRLNLRSFADGTYGVSLDETSHVDEVREIVALFASDSKTATNAVDTARQTLSDEIAKYETTTRKSEYMTHPVFNTHDTEHELLRYMRRLESRDLSLCHSMIPLGSCTMKLNATSEMLPITWAEFAHIHPFAPSEQTRGYQQMCSQLEKWLNEITGFAACWLQPNAGSQGEYAGLLMIRAYHESRGQGQRKICLIPESAHGTNPASAVIAGMSVLPVKCQPNGDIDLKDLEAKAYEHKEDLAAAMITYPSTHGVFEEGIKRACAIVHDFGGLVYLDGANMNAQVGVCRPGDFGADVCHLNLHKTFCIPHGGGGPGMGPICMTKELGAFVPKNSDHVATEAAEASDILKSLRVSAAFYGSASILPIPYVYIALMGGDGLKQATQLAILNANYMAQRLKGSFPILYSGKNGRCAHEFILDCRSLEKSANIKVEDIAKRLMDYGFHAPTMSWPVSGTLMIEPTESESKAELDRLCDALIAIRAEIAEIEAGTLDRVDNPLKHAPHTAAVITSDSWSHGYSRERAAFPLPYTRGNKFWPSVGRVDNVFGDRNLVCACPPMSDYQSEGDSKEPASKIEQASNQGV